MDELGLTSCGEGVVQGGGSTEDTDALSLASQPPAQYPEDAREEWRATPSPRMGLPATPSMTGSQEQQTVWPSAPGAGTRGGHAGRELVDSRPPLHARRRHGARDVW